MHLFTVIQLVLLLALLAIKSTQAALIFPFALILLMPIRHRIINRIFTPSELHEVSRCGAIGLNLANISVAGCGVLH